MSCDDSDKNKHDIFRLTQFKRDKLCDKNIAKTVFFRRFLGYVICQWSYFNAPLTSLTLIFFQSKTVFCVRQLVILNAVPLRNDQNILYTK